MWTPTPPLSPLRHSVTAVNRALSPHVAISWLIERNRNSRGARTRARRPAGNHEDGALPSAITAAMPAIVRTPSPHPHTSLVLIHGTEAVFDDGALEALVESGFLFEADVTLMRALIDALPRDASEVTAEQATRFHGEFQRAVRAIDAARASIEQFARENQGRVVGLARMTVIALNMLERALRIRHAVIVAPSVSPAVAALQKAMHAKAETYDALGGQDSDDVDLDAAARDLGI